MPELIQKSAMPCTPEELSAWHMRPQAFERLSPPWKRVRLISGEYPIKDGSRSRIGVGVGPFEVEWLAVHRDVEPGKGFRDSQAKGPFRAWEHRHSFLAGTKPGSSILEDAIEYELPFGPLGRLMGASIRRDLEATFRFRHARTAADIRHLKRLESRLGQGLKIAITGASGLVGQALTRFLELGGHEVHSFVRRPAREGRREIYWNPAREEIAFSQLEGFDAVVHLAGENVAGGRWTEARKKEILDSRVLGTELLARGLKKLARPPKVLISASAIGIYGHRPEGSCDEATPAGAGFLADVCKAWEKASQPATEAGVRLVNLRIGVVLSAQGGALAKMLPPFRMGMGGPVGSGSQGMSWIHIDDLIYAIAFLLGEPNASGPINAVAPEAVSNADFGRALGAALHRPAFMPLPGFAVKMIFGEMGQAILLEGALVKPKALERLGFTFEHPKLDEALGFELGHPSEPAAVEPRPAAKASA